MPVCALTEGDSTTLDPALQLPVDEIASDDGMSMEQLDMGNCH